jgi:hypothetical protein
MNSLRNKDLYKIGAIGSLNSSFNCESIISSFLAASDEKLIKAHSFITSSPVKDFNQNEKQDYILQINQELKDFATFIFSPLNKYFKAMTLKWEELGFDIDELKPKISVQEFGTSNESELVKQIRKNHFEKTRWQRIKLLKEKFDKFYQKRNLRRNAVCLKAGQTFMPEMDSSKKEYKESMVLRKELKELSSPRNKIKLPPLHKKSMQNIFSLTSTNVEKMDMSFPISSKDSTLSLSRKKSQRVVKLNYKINLKKLKNKREVKTSLSRGWLESKSF